MNKKNLRTSLITAFFTILCSLPMVTMTSCDNKIQPKKVVPTILFCHGHGGSKDDSSYFIKQPKLDQKKFFVDHFDFPNSTTSENNFYFNSNLGHGDDIATIAQHVEKKENSNKEYILWGFSRGGAAAVNYLAKHNPTNVKGLIIQSGLSDATEVVDNIQNKAGFKFLPNIALLKKIAVKFSAPGYPLFEKHPYEAVEKITNKDLPIFIFHSTADDLVPVSNAYKLYQAFQNAGFTHLYLYEMEGLAHCDLPKNTYPYQGKRSDLLLALGNFYKQEGLDTSTTYCSYNFSPLQPTADQIATKIKDAQDNAHAKYLKNNKKLGWCNEKNVCLVITALVAYRYRNQIGSVFKYGLSQYAKYRKA